MTIQLSCPSCQAALKVGEHLGGKRVKCPRCGQPVAVPAGAALVGAPAAPSGAGVGAAATPPPADAAVVACPGCSVKLRAKPEWAGKTLKCPKCAGLIAVPAARPAAPAEDDWIDITEPYLRPGAPAPQAVAAPERGVSGPWGEEVLEGHGLPDEMREQIRAALTKGERLTWAARPLLNVLMHRARKQRVTGVLVFLGMTIAMPVGAWFLFGIGEVGAKIAAC